MDGLGGPDSTYGAPELVSQSSQVKRMATEGRDQAEGGLELFCCPDRRAGATDCTAVGTRAGNTSSLTI